MTPTEFKNRRKNLRMSQKQLAGALGLSSNGDAYIRRIEGGKDAPSGSLLQCFRYLEILQKKHKIINLMRSYRLEKGIGLIEFCNNIGCHPDEWEKLQDFTELRNK